MKKPDLDTKLATLATKTELKARQDKYVKMQAHDLFSWQKIFRWWSVCLSANNWCVRVKKNNGTDYVLSWKSKGEILLNFNHCILFACKA